MKRLKAFLTAVLRAPMALGRAVRKAVDLRDAFVFGGLACATVGVAQIYVPAAWILVGATLFWLGVRR